MDDHWLQLRLMKRNLSNHNDCDWRAVTWWMSTYSRSIKTLERRVKVMAGEEVRRREEQIPENGGLWGDRGVHATNNEENKTRLHSVLQRVREKINQLETSFKVIFLTHIIGGEKVNLMFRCKGWLLFYKIMCIGVIVLTFWFLPVSVFIIIE